MQKLLTNRAVILFLIIIQPIPLILYPMDIYSIKSQEWWLALLLMIFSVVSLITILRKSVSISPWYLMGFAHGFNIISRLMTLFPHMTIVKEGQEIFNAPFTLISIAVMLFSIFILWYIEKPEVRLVMLRK